MFGFWFAVVVAIYFTFSPAFSNAARAREKKEKERVLAEVRMEQEEKKKREQEFIEKYGADDETVVKAIREELDNTDAAENMRKRLIEEADMVFDYDKDHRFLRPYFIALGILASSGKIPNHFLDYGIAWDRACVEHRNGYRINDYNAMEIVSRFVRWYDKELTDHGVPEHIMVRDGLHENDIRELQKLPSMSTLYWKTTYADSIHTAGFDELRPRHLR